MNDKPTSIKPGGKYRLWLQFEGGEAAADPRGVMSAEKVSKVCDDLVQDLMDGQPRAWTSYMGNTWKIEHLEPGDVTARVWVSEA